MTEVRDFAAKLETDVKVMRDELPRIVKRGAVNIKRDAQRDIATQVGRGHAKHYARSITFDLEDGGHRAEIGPQIGRTQAFLGKILEFGTATSPPHPHMVPALEQELPRFQKAVQEAAERILEG